MMAQHQNRGMCMGEVWDLSLEVLDSDQKEETLYEILI